MALHTTEDDLDLLDQYRDTENVGQLYDTDDRFASFIRRTIPGFEFPDFSWMTVRQVKAHIARL